MSIITIYIIGGFFVMLKGVNRQVVEITQPDSAYFEKVIFFVKPGFSEISEQKLRKSADEMIRNATTPPHEKIEKRSSERFKSYLKFSCAALAGSAVTALGMLIIF